MVSGPAAAYRGMNTKGAQMSTVKTVSERITDEVTRWPGITAGTGRRGEWSFQLGRREIGHLHGDHAAHFFFPKSLWVELHEQGRITEHPVFPGRVGPAARRMGDEHDVEEVIRLLRLNYERLSRN
jgi:hypothetical protein